MSMPHVRMTDGSPADVGSTTKSLSSSPPAGSGRGKTGRTRYLRIFPERLCYMVAALDGREFVALIRLLATYVMADGVLGADDKGLAAITQMGRRWPDLRDKLIALGLGRIDGGFWVDDDQNTNLDIQRRLSNRGSRGADARWGDRHA